MANAYEIFERKAPLYMRRLMDDFGFSELDAAAIMGNAGHESIGLSTMQEIKPIGGGRGGLGWFQWTASRRRNFERYCNQNRLNPASDDANYGFLVTELRGSEHKSVGRTKQAVGLENKVKAFERAFERAGVKSYGKRIEWARRALAASKGSALQGQPETGLLTFGARGDRVVDLQTKLSQLGYAVGEIDGVYGSNTRNAVSSFQTEHGLPPSGITDVATLNALAAAAGAPPVVSGAGLPVSDEALRNLLLSLLQRIISESRISGAVQGGPDQGQPLQTIIAELAKQRSAAGAGAATSATAPISSSTPPVLTWIDKLFPASEFLAGKKTALSVIGGAALGVLQLTPLGMPATAAQILATLIGGVGGLGLLSKVDRGVDLLGMIAKKPSVLGEPGTRDAGPPDARYGGFAGSVPFWER